MEALDHLQKNVRQFARESNTARIRRLHADRWIDYPRAQRALAKLEFLLTVPKRARMPCVLIHGESGMGKTMIIEKFRRDHGAAFDTWRGVERRDIVAFQMPPTPKERRFYTQLLYALRAPHNPAERLAVLEATALRLLKQIAPRMLVIDEVHHLLAGSTREQRTALNLLKFLANELRCVIIAVGTQDALNAMQSDPQMVSRFEPFELPRWQESDAFRGLLAAFARVFPLQKPSTLDQREVAQFVLHASGGITGRIAQLLSQAAVLAIQQNLECIDLALLEHVTQAVDA